MSSETLKMCFSPEDDVKLAELVSKHPSLFNAEHELYKDQVVRENVWNQISNELKKNECMKVWHRRCGPDYRDVESDGVNNGIKYVMIGMMVDELVPHEDSTDWMNPRSLDSPVQDRRTAAGDAPEPSGHLSPPVPRETCTREGHLLPRPVKRRSGPVQHPAVWPKRRPLRTILYPTEDEANTPVFEAVDSDGDVSNLVVGRFPDRRPRPKAVCATTTTTIKWTCALLLTVSVKGWPLPVTLPDWVRLKIVAATTAGTLLAIAAPLLAIAAPPQPQTVAAPPQLQTVAAPPPPQIVAAPPPPQTVDAPLPPQTNAAPLPDKPNGSACRRPNCQSRRCRRRRFLSMNHAADNGSS